MGGTPAPETKTYSRCTYKRYLPLRRRNASRKAARKRAPSLTESTSDCAVWVRSWRTKRSGTAFSRFVLPTARLPFVARNELAIATKSIASVLSPAARSPWVPSNLCRGGTAIWARRVKQPVRWTSCSQSERGGLHCANAEVQTPEERGNFNLIFTQYTLVEKKRHSFFREGR